MNKKWYGVIYIKMNDSKEDIKDKIARGKRIKAIRENELHMNKTQLASLLGISGQFLGLVESGRGNLIYPYLKKLVEISGHSADYILFGLDDTVITETKKLLQNFTHKEVVDSIELVKTISHFIQYM